MDARVVFSEGESGSEVTVTGPGLLRLDSEPFACLFESEDTDPEALPRYGDIIEVETLAKNRFRFRRVVQRASLRHYDFVLTHAAVQSEALNKVLDRVTREQGHWEIIFGGLLFIALPLSSGYDPQPGIMRSLEG